MSPICNERHVMCTVRSKSCYQQYGRSDYWEKVKKGYCASWIISNLAWPHESNEPFVVTKEI